MSRVGPLIIFGVTLLVAGGYWTLWDASRGYLDNILIEDVYYELMYFGFRALPAIIMIVGIMCLISAGVSIRSSRIGGDV